MTEHADPAEIDALVEESDELVARIRCGDDVEADLWAWSERVDRITGRRPSHIFAGTDVAGVRLEIKIKVMVRPKGEQDF